MLCFLNEKLKSQKFGIIKIFITKLYYVITLAYLPKLEAIENLTVIVKVFTQVIDYIFLRRKVFTHNSFTGYLITQELKYILR
jgi:hypothetical protein